MWHGSYQSVSKEGANQAAKKSDYLLPSNGAHGPHQSFFRDGGRSLWAASLGCCFRCRLRRTVHLLAAKDMQRFQFISKLEADECLASMLGRMFSVM